jgi:hypothetical protein
LLRELCVRTLGDDVERAWSVVDLAMSSQADEISKLSGHLWKPLRALRERAKGERDKAIEAEKIARQHTSNFFSAVNSGNMPTAYSDGHQLPKQGYPQEHDFPPTDNAAMLNLDFGIDRLYPLQTNQTSGSDLNSAPSLASPNPFWPQPFGTTQAMDGLNMNSMATDASPIGLQQGLDSNILPNQDLSWINASLDMSNNVPIATEDPMNWATFDDMVQQYAMQNEMHIDGVNTVPGFYAAGSSLF